MVCICKCHVLETKSMQYLQVRAYSQLLSPKLTLKMYAFNLDKCRKPRPFQRFQRMGEALIVLLAFHSLKF